MGLGGLEPPTSSLSGLLHVIVHVRQARLRCYPRVAVITLSRPLDRARDGHDLLIRSSMSGRPDPFRSGRDLGHVLARCPCWSGFPEGCSPRWLPAWLPAGFDLDCDVLPRQPVCRSIGHAAARGLFIPMPTRDVTYHCLYLG